MIDIMITFMNCCEFISESKETCIALLIGCIISILFVNILYYVFRNLKENQNIPIWNETKSTCQSPQCFRCNSSDVFTQLVRKRFLNFCSTDMKKCLSRIEDALLTSKDKIQTYSEICQNPTLLYISELPSLIWFNPHITHKTDVDMLEKNYDVILEEFNNINKEPGWIINERNEGCWKVYHLISQGAIVTENALKCPQTMNILKNLNSLMLDTIFGYATFSVIEPKTIIKPHFGSTNCRIRCHLGLKVNPKCYIKVAGQKKSWEVGKCLLFDDSYLHSVHHKGCENCRVVLMVDMWHYDLTDREKQCIRSIYSSDLASEVTIFTN